MSNILFIKKSVATSIRTGGPDFSLQLYWMKKVRKNLTHTFRRLESNHTKP